MRHRLRFLESFDDEGKPVFFFRTGNQQYVVIWHGQNHLTLDRQLLENLRENQARPFIAVVQYRLIKTTGSAFFSRQTIETTGSGKSGQIFYCLFKYCVDRYAPFFDGVSIDIEFALGLVNNKNQA
ncbi:MAG: hypothetical protein BWY75_02480 [bacterium ADurb.Bin425]|nr:MAG: hypothetical protein BWY75_02480 [bacterium ADurb.Bin425]